MSTQAQPLVLHVIHHLVIGGMENGLVNLINRSPHGSFRHVIACVEDYSDFRNRLTRADVDVVALHRSKVGVWKLREALYRLCKRLRPAIVHSRNLSGLDAVFPARLAGVRRCVHGEHGWDVQDLDGTRLRPMLLRRLHTPWIDRYITVSRQLQDYLVRRAGIAKSRITQIYNGVDAQRFIAQQGAPADLPWGLNRDKKPFVFGTVGRVNRVKNQTVLVEAFHRLVTQRPAIRQHVRLLIVGAGAQLAELQDQIRDSGLSDLAWLPGAREDVPALMRAMDVFVLPSLNEGISNTILEAMASGLPVVAAQVGGNPELITPETGLLYAAGDVQGLLGAMTNYLENRELARSHGAAGRTRVVGEFSLEAMVGNYLRVYSELMV
jgi:sugar transferase (PEP-CTERM/EpsH1 system associated)